MNVAELMEFLEGLESAGGSAKVVIGGDRADDIKLLNSANEAVYDRGDIGSAEDDFEGEPCVVLWFEE